MPDTHSDLTASGAPDKLDKRTRLTKLGVKEKIMTAAKRLSGNRKASSSTRKNFYGVRLKTGAELVTIETSKASAMLLKKREISVRELLTSYAEAVVKAQNNGQPLDLVIKVHPEHEQPAMNEHPAAGDALDNALAAARRRGAARVTEILKSPVMINAREFGPLVGMSHETVNLKRKSGEILGLEGTTRGFRYPSWQITADGRLLPGLAELTDRLQGEAWSVFRFLMQPHNELNGATGLQALQAGQIKEALAVADAISQGTFA